MNTWMNYVALVIAAAALIYVAIRYVVPSMLWLSGAVFGFRCHLRIAKLHGIDTAPIWAKAHQHIFCAWMERMDYCVTLRSLTCRTATAPARIMPSRKMNRGWISWQPHFAQVAQLCASTFSKTA